MTGRTGNGGRDPAEGQESEVEVKPRRGPGGSDLDRAVTDYDDGKPE